MQSLFFNPCSNFSSRTQFFQPNSNLFQHMSSLPSFFNQYNNSRLTSKISRSDVSVTSSDVNSNGFCTLMEYLGKGGQDVGDDLVVLLNQLAYACKRIGSIVASPFNYSLGGANIPAYGSNPSSDRDNPKPLDLVANEIILAALRNSGKVAVMASEEDDLPVWVTDDGPFVVVTDPLDGSRNIDASIPTGTIFGIYNRLVELDHLKIEEKSMLNSLQSGSKLVASGYVLYSSATILCISVGSGTHGFTLDRSTGDFILTHPLIQIPSRDGVGGIADGGGGVADGGGGCADGGRGVADGGGGLFRGGFDMFACGAGVVGFSGIGGGSGGQIYSVNDARYFDWSESLRRYIDTVRQGKGRYPKKYSARYICSLVADFHRTLLYGGLAMNPRDHLRLVYEANPLSFLAEQAGGKGYDGKNRILSLQPVKLHQRLPLFLGSPEDIDELMSFGDVQQKVNPGYNV